MTSAKEVASGSVPQQGVELLFPAGTGKKAKGAKLSKEQKKAAALLQKLKAIEKGGNVNAVDKQGQTALMHAAAANNRLAVCWLVAKGADASIKSKTGKMAGDLVKEENANMKELLKACCEEKLPLPEEEKRDYKSVEEAQRKLEKDGRSYLDTAAMALRAGAHADQLHPKIYDYPEENLAFLLRHGMPVAPFNKTDWKDATPPQLRLLLACGMPKESDETRKKLIFALLLDDVPGIEACLQQEPVFAKEAEYYGRAQSAAAVQALLKAAGEVPDGAACLKAVLATSYNGAAVKALLDAGVPVPTDEETLKLLVPDYYTGEDYATYRGELRSKPGVVQAMLDAGLDPNYTFSGGDSLLHRAARAGIPAVVQALLKKGANVNALNKYNDTPLSLVFAYGSDGALPPNGGTIAQALLKAGAKLDLGNLEKNLEDFISGSGFGPLSEKEQNEFITGLKAVLQAGFKVPADILVNLGNRSMPDAKWEEVALLLLEHGADPKATSNKKWDDGKTTLMGAGIFGPRIAQKLLDAGVDPNAVTKNGDSALKEALTGNHTEVAKLLHDKGARYSGELAICHPDCMQIMLDDGAKIPATIYEDLLEHGEGHSSNLSLTKEQYAQIIELLKKAGAVFDPVSVSFLEFSDDFHSGNPVAKSAFISSFQDPTVKDKDGSTLLFLADGPDIEKLIRAGVDPRAVNNKGQTPLFHRLSLEDIQTFTRNGLNVNAQDSHGNTALMYLVGKSNPGGNLKALLKAGANPNLKNNDGNTVLHLGFAKDTASLNETRSLLEGGADPNIKNKAGETPMQLVQKHCCHNNDVKNTKLTLLQEYGAKE